MLLLLLIIVENCICQKTIDSELSYAKLTLKNGTEVTGKVVSLTDSVVVLTNNLGEIRIKRADTADLQVSNLPFESPVQETVAPKDTTPIPAYWYPDNYYLLPTAIPIGHNVQYYQNSNILLNRVGIGYKNFSLEAGTEVISLLATRTPFFYARPKMSFGGGKSHASIGSFLATANGEFVALPFANYTYGGPENNFTFGLAIPVPDTVTDNLAVHIGANRKIGKTVSLTGEMIYVGGQVVFSGGLNFKSRKNYLLEIAFVRPVVEDFTIFGIPFFSVYVPFR